MNLYNYAEATISGSISRAGCKWSGFLATRALVARKVLGSFDTSSQKSLCALHSNRHALRDSVRQCQAPWPEPCNTMPPHNCMSYHGHGCCEDSSVPEEKRWFVPESRPLNMDSLKINGQLATLLFARATWFWDFPLESMFYLYSCSQGGRNNLNRWVLSLSSTCIRRVSATIWTVKSSDCCANPANTGEYRLTNSDPERLNGWDRCAHPAIQVDRYTNSGPERLNSSNWCAYAG